MPSQEDYLDNLLKGIGNTEEEENSRKESEEGVKDETLQDPQIDMSDMDDLLQSALEAQQRDNNRKIHKTVRRFIRKRPLPCLKMK